MTTEPDPYEYVLYIDEAGDDGLAAVKPFVENGASEWLAIGGLLVRREHELEVVNWVKSIRSDINSKQGPALHFRKLSPTKKLRACEMLGRFPSRAFCVLANKKNMVGHNNARAATRDGKQWFYNYCVRLLMERVTDFCARDSQEKYGEIKHIKVIFSKRGGHSYAQTMAYWEILKAQASGDSTYLRKRQINQHTLRFNLVQYVPHWQVAGLQLADIVASAFYHAAEPDSPNWSVRPAINLAPIMTKEESHRRDYSLVLQPMPPWKAELTEDQKTIFKIFGFSFEK